MWRAAGALTANDGGAYSQVFAASGGAAPYSYTLTGTLPAGLSFDIARGTLSGVPAEQGSFPISVGATDSSTGAGAPYSISSNYTFQVTAPTVVLAPATLPGAAADPPSEQIRVGQECVSTGRSRWSP